MYRCMGKSRHGEEIVPKAIEKEERNGFYFPACPDYEPRVHMPKRVEIDEVLVGWHCYNCKNLKAL